MDEEQFKDYSEEQDKHLAVIRTLTENNVVEIAIVKTLINKLEKSLFGNGRPGELDRITNRFEKVDNRLDRHDKWIYIATGIILAMQFLSGSGIISLGGLIGKH